MTDGLTDGTRDRIRGVFAGFPEVERAVLYGSRAKGNYRPGSDIDLALQGGHLDQDVLARIEDALDELFLPQRFDLSIFAKITHADLIEHIRRVGVVFYERATASRA